MISMYSEYLKERTEDDIIETEKGFVVYRYTDATTCYIVDIYVKPEFREQGVASDIADYVMRSAKSKGCTKLIGSVVPSAKGSDTSLRVLQAYGMKLDSCTNNFILFSKEIV